MATGFAVCRKRALLAELVAGLLFTFASCPLALAQTPDPSGSQARPADSRAKPDESQPQPVLPPGRCPKDYLSLRKIFLDENVPSEDSQDILDRTHMGLSWQRDFIAVILDMQYGDLYWYDDLENDRVKLVKIPKGRAFFPAAYTKEKMLVIVCNAHFNTSAGATPTSISVPEATAEIASIPTAPSSQASSSPPPALPPQAAPSSAIPKGLNNYLFKPEFHKAPPPPPPPNIPPRQPPTPADIQRVVDALQAYEKNHSSLDQNLNSWKAELDSERAYFSNLTLKDIPSIELIARDALLQNAAYDQNAYVTTNVLTPGPAQTAANASFRFNDALNAAVQLAKDAAPKIDATRKTLSKPPDFSATNSLNAQYQALWDAVHGFANSSADVQLLTTLINSGKWPQEQEEAWYQERERRITDHQTDIEKDASEAFKNKNPDFKNEDPNFEQLDNDHPEPPRPLLERIEAAKKEFADLGNDNNNVFPQQMKSLVDTLNNDYALSHVNIVIPVPSVSSNSLQLFTLTVNDNLKPLQLTLPQPSGKDSGSDRTATPCPTPCTVVCPSSPCPAPQSPPAPGSAAPTGLNLQLSAIKPGATPAVPGNPVQVSQQIDWKDNIAITATFIVPFHRIVHFAAIGGFLYAGVPSNAYTTETLPDAVVTTTTTTTTTTTGTNPGTTITQTIVPTTGTTTFAFQSESQGYQTAGILGIHWYPLGRDSFIVSKRGRFSFQPAAYTYARHTIGQNFIPGFLFATAVNTVGTFVVAPEWDVAPGVSLFGGLSLADKVSLGSGIIPCKSLGTSTNTVPYGPTTTSSGGTTVVTQVSVQTTTGCANANASMLSGTTVPTTTGISPGFGFGIVFNSNLFSYFAGKN
jgi:hypothetical protein